MEYVCIEKLTTEIMVHPSVSRLHARLAQSVEHQTFNLRVAGSSPSSGVSLIGKSSKVGLAIIELKTNEQNMTAAPRSLNRRNDSFHFKG